MFDAFWAGYNDYQAGLPTNPCGHPDDQMDWERGWRAAYENFSGEDHMDDDKLNSIKCVIEGFINDPDIVWSNSFIVQYDGCTLISVSCMDSDGYGRSRDFEFEFEVKRDKLNKLLKSIDKQ